MNRSFFSLLLYFNLGILLLRLYDVQLHMDCFAPLYLLILVNFSSPNENRLSSQHVFSSRLRRKPVWFKRLSATRSSARVFRRQIAKRIKWEQFCSQGSCERSSEKSGIWFVYEDKDKTCKPSDAIPLCETARSHDIKHAVCHRFQTWNEKGCSSPNQG